MPRFAKTVCAGCGTGRLHVNKKDEIYIVTRVLHVAVVASGCFRRRLLLPFTCYSAGTPKPRRHRDKARLLHLLIYMSPLYCHFTPAPTHFTTSTPCSTSLQPSLSSSMPLFAKDSGQGSSEATSEMEERVARHCRLQDGMDLILKKLRHDPKSITTEDARSLADNADEGDERTAKVIAAIADIALRNEDERGGAHHDHARSVGSASQSPLNVSQDVLQRLRSNPSSITEEDARRFSENVEATDARSARLISAVESLAAARSDIYGNDAGLSQSPHPSLLTFVKDLYAAVEAMPDDVDTEILKTTQSIVSSE